MARQGKGRVREGVGIGVGWGAGRTKGGEGTRQEGVFIVLQCTC